MMDSPVAESGFATTSRFTTWATSKIKEQTDINRQTRLWKEEQRHSTAQDRPPKKPWKDGKDDKDKGAGKKTKGKKDKGKDDDSNGE